MDDNGPEFVLHPRLAADSLDAGGFALCALRLMDEARWPWFLLVPRRPQVREPCELDCADHAQLWRESRALSLALMRAYGGDKLNIAALGNQVPQLHVHHIVRSRLDPAWPQPVWGRFARLPMSAAERRRRLTLLAAARPEGWQPPGG